MFDFQRVDGFIQRVQRPTGLGPACSTPNGLMRSWDGFDVQRVRRPTGSTSNGFDVQRV
ncbi:predicted protein [Histoplasma mississippiense (nom. inval.)]|uniref:predicted protein n=1 Tax=Ajellomyces capsulatus (strain NAm1 / WU24) TaxID=2059318 RepID=UPI000157D018|nr:predicted protein [Histoplasma mississippiense (nom. inval.)]EDN11023.1 predicted protein [Histoplasma mississippiense (nom. inval.)]